MRKWLRYGITRAIALAFGVALGICLLPVLAAPAAPSAADVRAPSGAVLFNGECRRELKDSDLLHWGTSAT